MDIRDLLDLGCTVTFGDPTRPILSGIPDAVIASSGGKDGPVVGFYLGGDFIKSPSGNILSLGTVRSKENIAVRASQNEYPEDPFSHASILASMAHCSILLGEFMVPVWSMFDTLYPMAEFYASAYAINGGQIYFRDELGEHDFTLLRKFVLPDGSILRTRLPRHPMLECLFSDDRKRAPK